MRVNRLKTEKYVCTVCLTPRYIQRPTGKLRSVKHRKHMLCAICETKRLFTKAEYGG